MIGKIGSGFIDARRDYWFNRIHGNEYKKYLNEYDDIKYLHIGPHRTGATFLQQNIFPHYYKEKKIFSDDTICGRIFDNGLEYVDKIHSMCPDAKIIVVLRNQFSMINSAYRTYVKAGGIWTFPQYAQEIIKYRKYDYNALLNRYFDLFGKENCFVFLYEDLANDPQSFVIKILAAIGVSDPKEHGLEKVKPGPTKYYNEYLRIVNVFVTRYLGFSVAVRMGHEDPSYLYPLGNKLRKFFLLRTFVDTIMKKIKKDRFFSKDSNLQFRYEKVKNNIVTAYHDSNRSLEKMLDMDLKKYGY